MFKKIWKKCNDKIYIILPILTLLCLAGFLGSLVFPDLVLDTYSVNMTEQDEDTEVLLPLMKGSHIQYIMQTSAKPMRGIQVGINKQGQFINGFLHYDVYVIKKDLAAFFSEEAEEMPAMQWDLADDMTLVSSNVYSLEEGFDLQYVYLPYERYEACDGWLFIDFYTEGTNESVYPALMANHTITARTKTICDNPEAFFGSLKCSYIYTHKTYPFLYDFRILTFIFLAASMTVRYPVSKWKKGGKSHV